MADPMTYYVNMEAADKTAANAKELCTAAYDALKQFCPGFSCGEYYGKWSSYAEDMRKFSKKHPGVIFDVTCHSDYKEDGDDENVTYLDGKDYVEPPKWPFKPKVGDIIFLVAKGNKTETSYRKVSKVGRVWFTVDGTGSTTRFAVADWQAEKTQYERTYWVYPEEAAYQATLVRPRVLASLERSFSSTIPRTDLSHVTTETLLQIEKMIAKPKGT